MAERKILRGVLYAVLAMCVLLFLFTFTGPPSQASYDARVELVPYAMACLVGLAATARG